jgi:hypothetical protein
MTSRATWPILCVLAAAGCGDAATGSPADAFVGTWRYTDVNSVLQCEGSDPLSQPPEPNKPMGRGIDGGLVDLSASPLLPGVFCDFLLDVAGPVATAHVGQSCALTPLDTVTLNQPQDLPPQYSFTLNSATTAEEIVDATVAFTVSGKITSCAWTLRGHLQRLTKD